MSRREWALRTIAGLLLVAGLPVWVEELNLYYYQLKDGNLDKVVDGGKEYHLRFGPHRKRRWNEVSVDGQWRTLDMPPRKLV